MKLEEIGELIAAFDRDSLDDLPCSGRCDSYGVCSICCARHEYRAALQFLPKLLKVAEAAEAFQGSLQAHYHGYPGKLEWPEVHVLRQALEGLEGGE